MSRTDSKFIAITETDFYSEQGGLTFSFDKNDKGEVTQLMIHVGSISMTGKKTK